MIGKMVYDNVEKEYHPGSQLPMIEIRDSTENGYNDIEREKKELGKYFIIRDDVCVENEHFVTYNSSDVFDYREAMGKSYEYKLYSEYLYSEYKEKEYVKQNCKYVDETLMIIHIHQPYMLWEVWHR